MNEEARNQQAERLSHELAEFYIKWIESLSQYEEESWMAVIQNKIRASLFEAEMRGLDDAGQLAINAIKKQ